MRDNPSMTTPEHVGDEPTVESLVSSLEESDPAQAPDIAEQLARRLGDDLESLDDGDRTPS